MSDKNDFRGYQPWQGRQRLLDGIEALYPADSAHARDACIGQMLLNYALEGAYYNWRHLPVSVLFKYLTLCEDYERQVPRLSDHPS